MSPSPSAKIAAGAPFPALEVSSLNGQSVDISKPKEGFEWKMIVVYRGKFCPLCTKYIKQLTPMIKRLNAAGVDVALVSGDSREGLEEHLPQMEVPSVAEFPIYHGMSVKQMQELGVYVSHPRSDSESTHPFAEPALFVINEEGNVQVVDISNNPFVRPDLESLASGIEFIRKNNYPIRGTYV